MVRCDTWHKTQPIVCSTLQTASGSALQKQKGPGHGSQLHLLSVSEAEVAHNLTGDRLESLLLPHERGASDSIAAFPAVVALRRGAAEQVQHQHAAVGRVQRRTRPPAATL